VKSEIKAIALDVDGVLTDGGIWWGEHGEEFKRFCFRDVMGISRAMREGIDFAFISGEESSIVDRYAAKFGIVHVWKGCRDKAQALREFAIKRSLELTKICFMGDDINDLPAIEIAGFSAAPADAHAAVLDRVSFKTQEKAGNGAVRELIDHLFFPK